MSFRTKSVFRGFLTTAFAVIFFLALNNRTQAGVVLDNDGRVIQITDIILPGENWTADITYSVSYEDLFINQSKNPQFLGDKATAELVAADMIFQAKDVPKFHAIIVPYDYDPIADKPVAVFEFNPSTDSLYETRHFDFSWGLNSGYAQFTLTGVPEPTSLVLFGGLSALGMVGRRRRTS